MFVLDTDHLTLLERGGSGALILQVRLGQTPPSELCTTIISYEEQMRGWLARIAQAKRQDQIVIAYRDLETHIRTFQGTPLLSFDLPSSAQFEQLRQARIRIGTKDLRIAAICLANDATLLTRNLKDFRQVPGLKAEDWSA